MAEISDTDSNAEALTRIMDDILLNVHLDPQSLWGFFRYLGERISAEGVRWDEDPIFNHWSWLQRIGVVVLSGVFSGGRSRPCPGANFLEHFYVTSRGRALLGSHETSPHNPVRFYERIRSQVAMADNVVMTYLDEAVGAWGAGLNRAVAVMIGCACVQYLKQAVQTRRRDLLLDRLFEPRPGRPQA